MENASFLLSVEDELTQEQAEEILSDLEEVLAKRSLSLYESIAYCYSEEDPEEQD